MRTAVLASAALGALMTASAAFAQPMDHAAHGATAPAEHDMSVMPGHDMAAVAGDQHAGYSMAPTGVLGAYPMTREASGTSWQPDASTHAGVHGVSGGWSLMGHAQFNGVYTDQQGPRGDDKAFISGMVMGAARRDLSGGGVLNLRGMLSPDPTIGRRGYPSLLASGETADGRTPLIDRQHPHDLFMELSASLSRPVGAKDSLFVYAGLPGEPAFGPPAFMHRLSSMDSPEAPISHHWLDSTHIVFGVVTAGWVHGGWKLEASGFRGREPDERRWNIERPKLDSAAVRLSWNPSPNWSLQGSWANIESPEQLEPELDERRWSASAIYTRALGTGWVSATAAWGRKMRSDGVDSDAMTLEAAYRPNDAWTLFTRAERLEMDELDAHGGHAHGSLETVGKLSLGVVHDWRMAAHVKLGLGGLYSFNRIPQALQHAYGSSPNGAVGFLRLVVD